MKKAILLVLTVVAVSASSVSAGTYSGGGNGTAEQPYRIATPADMNAIGAHPNDWDKHFVLVNDIDLADYTGTQFNIIGRYYGYKDPNNEPFTGVFDGNDHTISNFKYTVTDTAYIGLFGYVDDAAIKDLTLTDPNIEVGRGWATGALVGELGAGTITDCSIKGGSVSGEGGIGGLAGKNYGTISNCYVTGSVTGRDYTGGLVGSNSGTISNCYAAAYVMGDYINGGLVGGNGFGTIENCYVTGSVFGFGILVGGLVGLNREGTIKNCYATGSVSGDGVAGGLVGANEDGTIENCYATGSVAGEGGIGGLVGSNSEGAIANCYATGSVDGNDVVGGLVGGNGGTIENCRASGRVSADTNVGGLVGENLYGTIANSYGTGSVEGNDVVLMDTPRPMPADSGGTRAGGLVGANQEGTISNCYAIGSISGVSWVGGLVGYNYFGTIENCYAVGIVDGNDFVGGLIGYDYKDTGEYTKSFWDKEVNPDVNGIGNKTDPNVIGESTVNMQKESTFTDAGWDFTTPIWKICEDNDYPRLWWQDCPEPVEAELWIFPRVINRHSGQKNILAWIRLPEGIAKEQISDEPILLYPGEIEAVNQYVIEQGRGGHKRTSVLAFFKKAELMDAVVDNGQVELEAVGSLTSGRYFYGSDTVLIKDRQWRRWRRWR